MDNAQLPAFPPNAGWEHNEAKGLTKREYFAAKAMAAMIANPNIQRPEANNAASLKTLHNNFADVALMYADALISQLNEPPKP